MNAEQADIRRQTLEDIKYSDIQNLLINYSQPDKSKPEIKENLSFSTAYFFQKSGNYYLFTPLLLNAFNAVPESVQNRQTEFISNIGFIDEYKIQIDIPDKLKIEAVPSSIQLDTEFGKYELNIIVQGSQIKFYRKLI